jgi:hypothetical protein
MLPGANVLLNVVTGKCVGAGNVGSGRLVGATTVIALPSPGNGVAAISVGNIVAAAIGVDVGSVGTIVATTAGTIVGNTDATEGDAEEVMAGVGAAVAKGVFGSGDSWQMALFMHGLAAQ